MGNYHNCCTYLGKDKDLDNGEILVNNTILHTNPSKATPNILDYRAKLKKRFIKLMESLEEDFPLTELKKVERNGPRLETKYFFSLVESISVISKKLHETMNADLI